MNKQQQQTTQLSLILIFVMLVGAACSAPATQAPVTSNQAAATVAPVQDAATPSTTAAEGEAAEDAAPVAAAKLNLNTVTEEELLTTIPGFGNRMVREFFEYRPYVSIQQFRREIGKYVDEAQVADYEQYVYVPVNVNESDAATLMQIPGVDQGAADALVAARPYTDNAAFLTKLAEVVPSIEQAAAESYLEAQ